MLIAVPALFNPAGEAQEIEVTGEDKGRIVVADGFANYHEPVRLVRNETGTVVEYWVGGTRLAAETVVAKEMTALYRASSGRVHPARPE